MGVGHWELDYRAAVFHKTVDCNPFVNHIKPHFKQKALLLVNDVEEVLIAGGTRSGKSVGVLMAAAQYVEVPGYHAIIIRRSYPELEQPGGFIPLSREWWDGKADWNPEQKRWTFPSGATITFGHMDNDDGVQKYQGGGYSFVCFDEVTWHTEYRYTFMFSRLTKKTEGPLRDVPVRMRATANPNGRYMDWVKKRFVNPKTRHPGTLFIPAVVGDNPSVDAAQVEKSLGNTSRLMREQMLFGNWDAVESGQFQKAWLKYYYRDDAGFIITPYGERFLPEEQPRWQTCDPAAGLTESADDFVVSTWCLSPKANVVWLSCFMGHYTIMEQVKHCQHLYRRWNPQFFAVEEVLNQRALAQILRESVDPPMVVKSVNPRRKKKSERAIPAFSLASTGRLLLPEDDRAFPLDIVESQLLSFTGEQGNRDDACDSLFYSAEVLVDVMAYGGNYSPESMLPTTYKMFSKPRGNYPMLT